MGKGDPASISHLTAATVVALVQCCRVDLEKESHGEAGNDEANLWFAHRLVKLDHLHIRDLPDFQFDQVTPNSCC
jgi:hypothetical protein